MHECMCVCRDVHVQVLSMCVHVRVRTFFSLRLCISVRCCVPVVASLLLTHLGMCAFHYNFHFVFAFAMPRKALASSFSLLAPCMCLCVAIVVVVVVFRYASFSCQPCVLFVAER